MTVESNTISFLDLDGRREGIAYHWTFVEYLLRTPSKWDVGTGGSQQRLQSYHRGPTDEQHLFTKSSETDSTALLSGIHQICVCHFFVIQLEATYHILLIKATFH